MRNKETLSLDEFVTAPRRQRDATLVATSTVEVEPRGAGDTSDLARNDRSAEGSVPTGASKALRQMKRARMKGASHFVNVNLDRNTKRRLKLAAFNTDTSMQAIMEKAIRQYLDTSGY